MNDKTGILSALRGINKSGLRFVQAYVTQEFPLVLQSLTDSGLKIYDGNLLPLSERFSSVTKEAVIYAEGEEKKIEIEIDNSLKVEDIVMLMEIDMVESCKYYVLDKI